MKLITRNGGRTVDNGTTVLSHTWLRALMRRLFCMLPGLGY